MDKKTSSRTRSRASRDILKALPTTGPGTLGGEMLRRFWHPLCLSRDLKDVPFPVRMLGEDLVAFRTTSGEVGLVGARCPHRLASLGYGQIRDRAIQCSYHGWTFDTHGNCLAMPLEPANSTLCAEVKHLWYATEEWAGVVWCYMGPDKGDPPALPKIDLLARTDGEVFVERGILFPGADGKPVRIAASDERNYNYLGFLENFIDMGHLYQLHMLVPPELTEDLLPYSASGVSTDWSGVQYKAIETDYGLKGVVVHETSESDVKFVNTFSVALPTTYRFSGIPPDYTDDRRESGGMLRIIDDEHFEVFRFGLLRKGNYRGSFQQSRAGQTERTPSATLRGSFPKKEYDTRKYGGFEGNLVLEDLVMQESQGAIPDRDQEHLASSDATVVMLRRIWRQAIESVAAGKAPKPVAVRNDGVFEIDTFKGRVRTGELHLDRRNMPSSNNGGGLIRDPEGRLVFA